MEPDDRWPTATPRPEVSHPWRLFLLALFVWGVVFALIWWAL